MLTADVCRHCAIQLVLRVALAPFGGGGSIAQHAALGGRALELVPVPDLAKLPHCLAADQDIQMSVPVCFARQMHAASPWRLPLHRVWHADSASPSLGGWCSSLRTRTAGA